MVAASSDSSAVLVTDTTEEATEPVSGRMDAVSRVASCADVPVTVSAGLSAVDSMSVGGTDRVSRGADSLSAAVSRSCGLPKIFSRSRKAMS